MIRQILSRWLNKRRKIWRTYKKFSRNKSKNVYIRNRRKSLMQKNKRAKGVNENVVNDELRLEDYKNVLFQKKYLKYEINGILGKIFNIETYRTNKVLQSCYNDKKCILEDRYSRYRIFKNLLVIHEKNNLNIDN